MGWEQLCSREGEVKTTLGVGRLEIMTVFLTARRWQCCLRTACSFGGQRGCIELDSFVSKNLSPQRFYSVSRSGKVLTRADEHAIDLVRDMPCLPPPTPTFLLCFFTLFPAFCLCSLSPLLAGAAGFHLKDNYLLSGASQITGTVPYPSACPSSQEL